MDLADNIAFFLADQGLLKFKTRIVSNDEGLNAEKESRHLTEAGESSLSIQNEEMV
jgi:hypothetical protein